MDARLMRRTMRCGREPLTKIRIAHGRRETSPTAIVDLHYYFHSLVPVIATGFEDLQKRVEAQTQQASEQQQKIKVHCLIMFSESPQFAD